MNFFELRSYSLEDVNYLINNEVEESVHLDYKDGAALKKDDKGKIDITKDVSSFANSDGGILIYGISEQNHKPVKISPFDGRSFTKEWLEQIISNIQPHIKGVEIFPIRIDGNISESIYVVKIPRSYNAPHMATDNKYYKRYIFMSIAMEDYEVRDLFNRTDKPELEIEACVFHCESESQVKCEDDFYKCLIYISVINISNRVCTLYKVSIIYPTTKMIEYLDFAVSSNNVKSVSHSILYKDRIKFSFSGKEPIFPKEIIDFLPYFRVPYARINQLLEIQQFEIILWYEGGCKKYSFNIDSNSITQL